MDIVTRDTANGLLGELKHFAFSQSEDFRDGLVDSIDLSKTFTHAPEIPRRLTGGLDGDLTSRIGRICRPIIFTTMLGLEATREPASSRKVYTYHLLQRVQHTVDTDLPDHYENLFDRKQLKRMQRLLHANPGIIQEADGITYAIGSDEPRTIQITQAYDITLGDEVLHATTDVEQFFSDGFEMHNIPPIESDIHASKLVHDAPIKHERLAPVFRDMSPDDARLPLATDQLLTDIQFQQQFDPDELGGTDLLIDYYEAAKRVRGILYQMRTGRIRPPKPTEPSLPRNE